MAPSLLDNVKTEIDTASELGSPATNSAPSNLAGMRVVFTGLGDTAPPQQPLPAPTRTVLVALWTKKMAAGRCSPEPPRRTARQNTVASCRKNGLTLSSTPSQRHRTGK